MVDVTSSFYVDSCIKKGQSSGTLLFLQITNFKQKALLKTNQEDSVKCVDGGRRHAWVSEIRQALKTVMSWNRQHLSWL